jgi:hypothetical protein
MVGAGSGMAPFRGFIQARVAEKVPENIIFFGCYNKDLDFIYEDELNQWYGEGRKREGREGRGRGSGREERGKREGRGREGGKREGGN